MNRFTKGIFIGLFLSALVIGEYIAGIYVLLSVLNLILFDDEDIKRFK